MQTTMPSSACPPSARLRDYLSGKLNWEDSDVLSQHLLDCAVCEQTATSLEHSPDTLVELLQADLLSDTVSLSTERPGSGVGNALNTRMPIELGQYELQSQLGAGGMGTVWLARHRSLDKQVAVKLLPALPAQNAEFVARFQREMRAAGQLDHPAIVRTRDAGDHEGIHFLVMDLIDGMNFSDIAAAEEKLSVADACDVIRQASMGLTHAHEKGIVHRDVKPSNLMLDCDGRVRILDFGLAQIGLWDSGAAEITTVGQLMGTLDYMAPEQAERGGAVDYRADLYSLGATLFRLLTGRAPLAAAPNLTPLEKLRLLATHKPPKLRSLRSDVPEQLGQIVDAMLSRDPAERPASAVHVAELLEPFAGPSDLVGALNRAKSKPPMPQKDFAVNPLLQRHPATLTTSAAATPNVASEGRGSSAKSGWRTWLTAAGFLSVLCAGVMFVIETSKGQLVIDSQADVQVKILKVAEDGQQAAVDELHIEPGTQTTRLSSGRYAITLDSASDSFGLTNGTFTIRNGETVVATITPRNDGQAAQSIERQPAAQVDKASEDPRLNELVYDGETLDTWLRRLKFERNQKEVSRALQAVDALADESLRNVMEPRLIEFALSDYAPGSGVTNSLAKCCGSDFPRTVAGILGMMEDNREKTRFLETALSVHWVDLSLWTKESSKDFWSVAESMLHSESQESVLRTASMLCQTAVFMAERGDNVQFQERILGLLLQTPSLTDDNFWLQLPPEYNGLFPLCSVFRQEVARRAVAVIADREASDPLFAQATIELRTVCDAGEELTKAQRESLVQHLGVILNQAADNPKMAAIEVAVPYPLRPYVSPITPFRDWSIGDSQSCSPLITTLNLVNSAGLAKDLEVPLKSFYESVRQLPLYSRDASFVVRSSRWSNLVETHRPEGDLPLLLCRFAFLQSGVLLGKNQTELFVRFETRLPADFGREVESQLPQIEFGNPEGQFAALRELFQLSKLPSVQYPPQAAQVLEAYFTADYSDIRRMAYGAIEETMALWVQAAGDGFLASYSRAVKNADESNRSALLSVKISEVPGFQCTDPIELQPLLNWCDDVMASESAETSELKPYVTNLLSGLVSKNKAFSIECQQQVVDHLERYKLPDSEFWLNRVSHVRRLSDFGPPMRQAIISHAIDALKSNSNDTLTCQSLVILAVGVGDLESLTEKQRSALAGNLRQRLDAVVEDPASHAKPCEVSGNLGNLLPQFCGENLVNNGAGTFRAEPCTNPTVLILNLLMRLEANSQTEFVEKLKPAVKSLNNAVERMNLSDPTLVIDVNWMNAVNGKSGTDLMMHTWFVQTGALLGRDVAVLNARPAALYKAEQERKLRTVQPGDTLAVHIPAILPLTGEPPVLQAGTSSPVIGYPVPVSKDGTIQLPQIKRFSVKGLDLLQVQKEVEMAYTKADIVVLGEKQHASVQFLVRAGQAVEVRNITGSSAVAVPKR